MRLYKGPSPKRHVAYSNSCWIARFNLGRLIGWKPSHNKTKNTATYVDKVTGVKKWHGTKALKTTESIPQNQNIPPSAYIYTIVLLMPIYGNCRPHKNPQASLTWVRHYPLRFGMRLVQMFPRLLEDCRVAKTEPERDAKEIFSSMVYLDNWDDADLRSCILYVRGSWNLRIPDDWRHLLPVRIWKKAHPCQIRMRNEQILDPWIWPNNLVKHDRISKFR